MSTKELWNWL